MECAQHRHSKANIYILDFLTEEIRMKDIPKIEHTGIRYTATIPNTLDLAERNVTSLKQKWRKL